MVKETYGHFYDVLQKSKETIKRLELRVRINYKFLLFQNFFFKVLSFSSFFKLFQAIQAQGHKHKHSTFFRFVYLFSRR